jgi:hypothetical protein
MVQQFDSSASHACSAFSAFCIFRFIKVNISLSNFTAHIQIYALTNFTEDVMLLFALALLSFCLLFISLTLLKFYVS